MTTVLLLRHGEIPQAQPRRFIGQRDVPLTEHGRAQASLWSRELARLPLTSAWCSSLGRCRETAKLALAECPLSATPLDDLREINLGHWEGLTVGDVRERFPGEYEKRGADIVHTAPAGGESFAQAQERAWLALRGILDQSAGVILVVAHAGVNRAMLCRALGMPLARLFSLGQDYAALSVIDFTPLNPPQLRVLNLPPQSLAPWLGAIA